MEFNRKSRRPAIITLVVIVVSLLLLGFFSCIRAHLAAREGARRVKCLSNLKLLCLGLKQYSGDNDEVFAWEDSDSGSYYRALGRLHPHYVSDLSLFTCPFSSDDPMRPRDRGADGSLFEESECRKGLSYAYGHNQGKPWTEQDPHSVRLLADKYAAQDYTSGPSPKGSPINHRRRYGMPMGRNVAHIDGSTPFDKNRGPLEADPETQIDEDSDPRNDQTGPDWFSDPPDK